MARLEQLVENVADERLRREIESEIAALKERTSFGLVYERHLPETALIGDPEVLHIGDLVRPKQDVDKEASYRVVGLDGADALIAPETNGHQIRVPVSDLFRVMPFGEPIFPALAPLEKISHGGDKPYHAVIDGENFHALQL